ncbi:MULTISPECIES: ABC transporter permease [Acutalibacteraceae]|uniref:ABC transporter permease n=1 Tax=Acutalibacteraceae TaxID=3082771 RepID=UPI001FA9CB25|nr:MULTISPECIES: ABC transporter permease [Acutalibacteraceae]
MTKRKLSMNQMRLSEIMHLVWINIMESKFKVFLTSLGVIVGSATIIMVIAVGHGGEVEVQNEYKTLNAGSINVAASTSAQMQDQMMGGMMGGGGFPGGGMPGGGTGGGMPGGGGSTRKSGGSFGGGMPGGMGGGGANGKAVTLTTTDEEDIQSLVSGLSYVSMYTSDTSSVDGGELDEETDETVVGVESSYQDMCNLDLLQGEFITDEDDEDKSKVAVVGYTVAQSIFGSAYSAYGDSISIEGKKYEIVGVLNEMGSVSSGTSPDDSIFVPYQTAVKYIYGKDADPQIMAIASDVNTVSDKITEIKSVLMENHSSVSENAFNVTDAGSTLESATSSAKTLSMLLMIVAAIVFIVGGIGIMNVMFVSVKERTQEIGILKALGSSKKVILLQFLLEATFISVFGGLLGVVSGFALIPLVRLSGMTVEPVAASALYSMVFAVSTGTVFGFYPAWKAAALMPIEALTQE